jgi:hypothetical protein
MLCDFGASIGAMPRDVKRLWLPKLEPTVMSLELGDNSIRYPMGITEDVPLKVEDHFIPIDFLLKMWRKVKLLLFGRLFLNTIRVIIDIGKKDIKIDINGETAFKFQPCFEVRNITNAKYVPPHCCIGMIMKNQGICCNLQKIKPACEDKKMTKPKKKPAPKPKIVQKWVPKIATPTKSVDLK